MLDRLNVLDEFVNAVRLKDGMSVSDVALVIDLHQDVAPTVVEYPTGGVIGGAQYGSLVPQPLVLAEIDRNCAPKPG